MAVSFRERLVGKLKVDMAYLHEDTRSVIVYLFVDLIIV